MEMNIDMELYDCFEKRLASTYALNEEQKGVILSHRDELDEKRMADILKTIAEHVSIIDKNSRTHWESEDQETDRLEVRKMLDGIVF